MWSVVLLITLLAAKPPLGLDLYRPVPEENPLTPQKIALGRKLFFDKRLSRDRTIACATCHDPRRAFTDGRNVAVGVQGRKGTRNVPVLINRVYGKSFFHDGRAESLERQAMEPIFNPKEMDMTRADLEARLNMPVQEVTAALASYVRTILAGGSAYDRYTNGDGKALSAEARAGLSVFRGKGRCIGCHAGPNLTDEVFHNTGIAWPRGEMLDPGRFTVSGQPEDRGAFKTPTLREIARTGPYMHDGSILTLEAVIDYYDRGGNPNPALDIDIRPLNLLPEEKRSLVAFLRSLSGRIHEGVK